LVAAQCATTTLGQDKKAKDIRVKTTMYVDGATGTEHLTLAATQKNVMILLALQRGLLDIADYAALVHRTLFSTVAFGPFMSALHSLYRKELHEIKEALETKDQIGKDLSTSLDQNAFFVLGARLIARDQSALGVFFRKERVRYEDAAKKCGWKPIAPAVPSPDRVTGKRNVDEATATDKKEPGDTRAAKRARFQAKKLKKKAAAAAAKAGGAAVDPKKKP
jgi:hypothetical protein